ncbi:sensor histidine kinase [Oscillospiraceae bacterium PP1C4]
MKNLKYSLPAKITAIFLFIISLIATFGGTAGIVYMAEEGYYNPSGYSFYSSVFCDYVTRDYADTVYYNYFKLSQKAEQSAENAFRLEQYKQQFAKENTNFFFTITDTNDKEVLSNYEQQDYGALKSFDYHDDTSNGETYTLNAYIKNPITAKDSYYTVHYVFQTLYSMRYITIALVALSAVLDVVLFIFLLCSAGHRKGEEEIVLNAQDKIPFDLYAAGIFMALLFLICTGINVYGILEIVLICTAIIAAVLLGLALCMTLAARYKKGKWWRNTVLYRGLKLVCSVWSLMRKSAQHLLSNLPLLWKSVWIFAGYLFINGVFVLLFVFSLDSFGEVLFPILTLLFNGAVLVGLCFIMLQMHSLKCGGEKIAGGDFNCKINTENMLWDLKMHGETLNNISSGMSKAVEERMKSERLKTELITNVSHDIKTPLTSIVNYVDLLKKENIENKNAVEYVEVLDRQSARLKKLIEDLVEASKASTGNLSVNPVRTDIVELLNQSIGEYTERFAASKLETIIHTPQNETAILADGRLLWRVFDNLLNNICKYSQPNTRVYLDVDEAAGKIMICFKNISQYPLNITTDELLERFVRGDSARTTEGSGLGLSIAKSLTELQKGSFKLSVDGDLFKIVISFDSMI